MGSFVVIPCGVKDGTLRWNARNLCYNAERHPNESRHHDKAVRLGNISCICKLSIIL